MKGIVGKKMGMTQAYDETGRRHALSVIKAEPGIVVRVKSAETDGYDAIQVGFAEVEAKKLNRPDAGQFKKHLPTKAAYKTLKEFRVENPKDYKVGQAITVELFAEGELVDVQGVTVGKGFAGNVKRNHFGRGPMSHGSKNRRESGSIGTSAAPSRVVPGRRMPGQLGNKTRTVQRIRVFRVDAQNHLIFLLGGVPGHRNGIVTVHETVKKTK